MFCYSGHSPTLGAYTLMKRLDHIFADPDSSMFKWSKQQKWERALVSTVLRDAKTYLEQQHYQQKFGNKQKNFWIYKLPSNYTFLCGSCPKARLNLILWHFRNNNRAIDFFFRNEKYLSEKIATVIADGKYTMQAYKRQSMEILRFAVLILNSSLFWTPAY